MSTRPTTSTPPSPATGDNWQARRLARAQRFLDRLFGRPGPSVSDRLGALVDEAFALGKAIGEAQALRLDADQAVHLEYAELAVLELLTHTKRAQLRIAADPAHWRPAE